MTVSPNVRDGELAQLLADLAGGDAVQRVPIRSLLAADTPRLSGERIDHVRALADAPGPLPPVLVHRGSMRIVDGMHRVRAAQLRGERSIEVRFYDGAEELLFVAAVQANNAHGLPLSLADREAAAVRILASHGHWSDRTIAAVVGLAANTVGAVRRRSPDRGGDTVIRMGRDGRLRPLSTAEGRRLASKIIEERPEASLRAVARAAGISTGTVRDVRRRLARGEDPVLPRLSVDGGSGEAAARRPRDNYRPSVRDRAEILRHLRNDPTVRFAQSGRAAVRWLDARSLGPDGWEEALRELPPHCGYFVAELAQWCAERWRELAEQLRADLAEGTDR